MDRTLELQYDELVIGADLSALLFCYIKKIPFIFIRHKKPYYYADEKGFENQTSLWNSTMFMLSLNNLCPFSNLVQSIRLEDDNVLRISTKNNFLCTIKYNKLYISDDFKLEGLPEKINKNVNTNLVVDLLAISQRNIGYSEISSVKKTDNILYDVNLTGKYILDRKHTLVICKSIMDDEEIKTEQFSESMIRLGFINMFYPKIKEAKHIKREIYEYGKNIYRFPSNIRTLTESPLEIMSMEEEYKKYFSFTEKIVWKK